SGGRGGIAPRPRTLLSTRPELVRPFWSAAIHRRFGGPWRPNEAKSGDESPHSKSAGDPGRLLRGTNKTRLLAWDSHFDLLSEASTQEACSDGQAPCIR